MDTITISNILMFSENLPRSNRIMYSNDKRGFVIIQNIKAFLTTAVLKILKNWNFEQILESGEEKQTNKLFISLSFWFAKLLP